MPVQRFRTKIVEVDAIRYTGENAEELFYWTVGFFRKRTEVGMTKELLEAGEGKAHYEEYGEVFDELHDTWIRVTPGQWIVRGAKGEFYPCDDETFHWKYEEVPTVVVQRDPDDPTRDAL